jgi:hypothetical protein
MRIGGKMRGEKEVWGGRKRKLFEYFEKKEKKNFSEVTSV